MPKVLAGKFLALQDEKAKGFTLFYILIQDKGFMIWNPPIKDIERIMDFIKKSKDKGYKELDPTERKKFGNRLILELHEVVRGRRFDAEAFIAYLDETYV